MERVLQGIGVVFNIDELGGGFYGFKVWKLFMKHLDPLRLAGVTIVEGDTKSTIKNRAREFCIAVLGGDTEYIRTTFANLDEKGLAPKNRRFIEKSQLASEPLTIRGRIDTYGRFETESWTRVDHDLCKETGWGYNPKRIPKDLSDDLRTELKKLMEYPKLTRSNKVENMSNIFDEKTMSILHKLPRKGNTGFFWNFMHIISYPFIFLGGIGLAKELVPIIMKGPEYEHALNHMGRWLLFLLFAGGILAIGLSLRVIAQHYKLKKSEIGDLVDMLLRMLASGNIEKMRSLANTIDKKTGILPSTDLPLILAKAMSLQFLAETLPTKNEKVVKAKEAIMVLESLENHEIRTPFVYLCTATSFRIIENVHEAISYYKKYLEMCPDDTKTKSILESLLAKQ